MKNIFIVSILLLFIFVTPAAASRRKNLSDFQGHPPIHIAKSDLTSPSGLTPDQIKKIYNIPNIGGKGTIAIVDAYDYPNAENDLSQFSSTFNLPDCTVKNGCFEKHLMDNKTTKNIGWDEEQALDIEWAHAIAPKAKILLIEAKSASGPNLMAAVDYARKRQDVVAISLSWGGQEFSTEKNYDSYFVSQNNSTFFVSAGDNGSGAQWPAVSPNVIAVGGTSLIFDSNGSLQDEVSWSGSGGGVSSYEKEPTYQIDYEVPDSKNMRAVPDVAYNADPASGYAIYCSANSKEKGWFVVGGTSAGAPQWAAIRSLNDTLISSQIYTLADSKIGDKYFNDILSGKNGSCRYYCKARKGYDYVTGLGSPLTAIFSKT